MNKALLLLALAIPVAAAAGAQATDSITSYNTLLHNAPQHIRYHNVPRFALLGKEGKYYIGIGAEIKVTPTVDFGSVIDDPNYFTTSAIPMTPMPGNGEQFKVSAQQSNIYINVVALPGTDNQVGAYVLFNFLGHDYTPHLAHAYLRYHNVTAGFTYSIFGDVSAAPATIDYEGPNAMAAIPHAMIAYEPSFGRDNCWRAGIGIDMPEESYTNATRTATVTQRLPDIPFYIQRFWNGTDNWLRLSGIVRNLYYRNTAAQRNIDKAGWGVHASGKAAITPSLAASFSALYGSGIASYIQDLNGEGLDLMPSSGEGGASLDAVRAWAAYGSLHYRFSPTVFSTATYGHVRTYAGSYTASDSPWGAACRYSQYVAVNTFCDLNSITQVGIEYLYGRRVDYSGTQSHDNRLQAMLRVSF